ncbi:PadR family transcriptional regulator [Cellulomonas sp. NS3]|uniref:PadR family transcriptional regulator n=1 Tax=Cellulomonas sp. NS3 TaxID=2973977 RepID=UPI002162BA91|nr:PadR family transcriptional regulator [Cellulomonas sp. NS3]
MRHPHHHHRDLPSGRDRTERRGPDPADAVTGRTWRVRRNRGGFPGFPADDSGSEPGRRGGPGGRGRGDSPSGTHRGGPFGGHGGPFGGHAGGPGGPFGGHPGGPGGPFGHGHPGGGPFGPEHGFGPHMRGRGPGRGPGRRAGRGDIRAAVLLLLVEQPMHGYQLIQEIGERTGGRWRPSPGAIYPALSMLEDEGLVTITAEQGRKLARLTEAGQTYVAEHADELGSPWQDAQDRPVHPGRALREAMEALGAAAGQVARTGDEAQTAQALAVIDRARRELYLVLAGEPAGTSGTTPPTPAPEA